MASPDWVGRGPTYAVHFSSYREKSNAERDAARVERRYGVPAHAVRVAIPGQGEIYRVIVGGFESAAAARSYRAGFMAERAAVSPIYWLVPLR